jgi:arylsulfatase A-like enzyme
MRMSNWQLAMVVTLGLFSGSSVAAWRQQIAEAPSFAGQPKTSQEQQKSGAKQSKPADSGGVKTYTGEFNGMIGRTIAESVPAWPAPVRAKKGSPNVLFIVLDDSGFADTGSFGGLIRTPNLDQLARNGLRYNNFHTTALCSPTRSCLLTGRNHHANALGVISERATGFPGYNGQVPFTNGFLSEILRRFGYLIFGVGKWHLTPDEEMNAGATRIRWPLGRGFDRFYGFLGGDTHQYYPDLVYDNHPVDPPKSPQEGYHFTPDMTDKAIQFINDGRTASADMPFFLYYCPGAMHAPHHTPQKWIDKYKGKFDMGWDKARETILNNQIRQGVVPGGTVLPPREKEVQDWAALTEKQKQLYARFMEVYAGMLEQTDHEIGRLLDTLKSNGQLDNTLIFVVSDNGASAACGPNGRVNEGSKFNGVEENEDFVWQNKDKLGGPESFPGYPAGWAMAGNTPFKRWKSEIHLGGVRDPLIVHWPKGIQSKGVVRQQYVHAIDLVPTVLEVLRSEPPDSINGHPQTAIHGISFAHTFEDAKAASKRRTQYFEMFGSRAIYHDGWVAVSPHIPAAVPLTEKVLQNLKWELYHTDEDFNQTEDLAAKHPEKVKELEQLWWAEAGKYNVLPLDSNRLERGAFDPRPELSGPRNSYEYLQGAAPVNNVVAAPTLNCSYRIAAEIVIPEKGAEGVILAHGGSFGGWSLYVKESKLHFTYNWQGREYTDISSPEKLPVGKAAVAFNFQKTGKEKFGAGGQGQLFINGKVVAESNIPKTNPFVYWPHNEGLTCGYDHLTPVTRAYQTPFRFTGMIERVVVTVDP